MKPSEMTCSRPIGNSGAIMKGEFGRWIFTKNERDSLLCHKHVRFWRLSFTGYLNILDRSSGSMDFKKNILIGNRYTCRTPFGNCRHILTGNTTV